MKLIKKYQNPSGGIDYAKPQNDFKELDAISGADIIQRQLDPVVVNANQYDEHYEWLQNWYKNRRPQLIDNTRYQGRYNIFDRVISFFDPEKVAKKYTDKYLNDLQNLKPYPEYIVTDRKNISGSRPSIQQASDKTKQVLMQVVNNHAPYYDDFNIIVRDFPYMFRGLTVPGFKTIFYQPNPDEGTIIHERTHAFGPKASEKSIFDTRGMFNQKFFNKSILNDGYDIDQDLDLPDEIQARLNALRYQLKLDPKKVWNIKEIRELKNDTRYDSSELDLDRYNDDFLLHLFNEVAQNKTSKEDDNLA